MMWEFIRNKITYIQKLNLMDNKRKTFKGQTKKFMVRKKLQERYARKKYEES